jgi:hypothetical protein
MKMQEIEPEAEPLSMFGYIMKFLPIALSLVVCLMSAGYIFIRIINAKRHNERWADYDECGII